MTNGGWVGKRNVLGVDGYSGVYSMREVADAVREGVIFFNEDTFNSDSTAQYTQFSDAPGTWAIAGGELVATGGTQSVFIRNGTSFTNVVIESDANHIHDGGLILRFIDNSNYYLLRLGDDSGPNAAQNVTLFKRVSGTFTSMGTVNIAWARGSSKKIRLSAVGTTLAAAVDGTVLISITDSALAGPGGVGMRNNLAGQQSKYQAFRWAEMA